jgi:hypothetical protein
LWRVPWRLGPAGNSTRRRFFGQKSAIAGLLACGGGHLYPSLSVRRKARPLLCLAERRHDGAESCQQQVSSFHRSSLEGGWANWCSTRTISIDSGHVIVRAGNVTVTNIMTATMEQSAHSRPAVGSDLAVARQAARVPWTEKAAAQIGAHLPVAPSIRQVRRQARNRRI